MGKKSCSLHPALQVLKIIGHPGKHKICLPGRVFQLCLPARRCLPGGFLLLQTLKAQFLQKSHIYMIIGVTHIDPGPFCPAFLCFPGITAHSFSSDSLTSRIETFYHNFPDS
jgi:hypothetical protein